jgi:hypothetical protein
MLLELLKEQEWAMVLSLHALHILSSHPLAGFSVSSSLSLLMVITLGLGLGESAITIGSRLVE